MRVTDSGTRRRFEEEELLSAGVSFSPRGRRGSDPVLSDVDWLGLLADALLSPNEGRILRKFEEDMFKVSKERRSLRNHWLLAEIMYGLAAGRGKILSGVEVDIWRLRGDIGRCVLLWELLAGWHRWGK